MVAAKIQSIYETPISKILDTQGEDYSSSKGLRRKRWKLEGRSGLSDLSEDERKRQFNHPQ